MQKIGNYQLGSLLGAGGHGQVFLSNHPVLGRPVALKVLHDDIARDAELRKRFLREARLTLDLHHPGIVNLYDIGQSGKQLYIVMELFEHGSLEDAIDEQHIPLPVALDVAAEIADALAYAHDKGVIHRDIKPSNVLLRADGTPVLADFGLATDPRAAKRVTANGAAMGTPEYMAPEQFDGREADQRSDIYSFGVMLYEMLVGKLPFGGTLHQIVHGHVQVAAPAMRNIDPSLPAQLEALVTRLLAKDPQQRPASMSDVAAELRAIRGNRPATGAPIRGDRPATGATIRVPQAQAQRIQLSAPAIAAVPAQPTVKSWARRHPFQVAAVGLVIVLAVLVGMVWQFRDEPIIRRVAAPPPPLTPIAIEALSAPLLTEPLTFASGEERWSIGSISTYQDAATIRTYGIVRLDGATARKFPSVRMILRDANGTEIVSEDGDTRNYYFKPGDFGVFQIVFDSDDSALPAEGEYSVDWEVRSDDAVKNAFLGTSELRPTDVVYGRQRDVFAWQAMLAVPATPVKQVQVSAAWFGPDGRVVGIDQVYIDDDELTAGQDYRLEGEIYTLAKQPSSMVVLAEAVIPND